MAENGEILVDTIQPQKSASMTDCAKEDNNVDETTESRKRPGGSSPVKDSNPVAPLEKRARFEPPEFQGTEPRPLQPVPQHPRWPPHSQWSQADAEYHLDRYGVGPRSQPWHNGHAMAPQWHDAGIPYNIGREGPWRGNMNMGVSPAPWGYQMYAEGEMLATLPAYPPPSRGPLRAPIHVKDRQPAPTSTYVEDVYSFEPPESSATKTLPNVQDSAFIAGSSKPAVAYKNGPLNLQQIQDKEESDKFARGQPIETGGPDFNTVGPLPTKPATTSKDVQDGIARMELRLQALEGKFSEYWNLRLDVGAIVSELASLNSSVRALSEALVSSFKTLIDKLHQVPKLHADNALAATPEIGKTTTPPPLPSLGEPGVGERTRFYKRVPPGSRGKEVIKAPSPPPSDNTEAAPADEGAGGSTSPGSDCALISPPAKVTKPAVTPKKKPSANARGKALAKEREVVAGNEDLPATATALTVAPAKKNAGGARGKGGRFASARNTKSAWPLDVDRTPVPPKKTPYGAWAKGELVDLFHPDEPDRKVAECCTISACAGEPFHGMSIAAGMYKVIMGRVLVEDCPLFVTVEDDMPPQLTLLNVKRGMTVWPGSCLRPHEKS